MSEGKKSIEPIIVAVSACPRCKRLKSNAHYKKDFGALGEGDLHSLIILPTICFECSHPAEMRSWFGELGRPTAGPEVGNPRRHVEWSTEHITSIRQEFSEEMEREHETITAQRKAETLIREMQDRVMRAREDELERMCLRFDAVASATEPSAPEGAPDSDQQGDPSQDRESN